MTGRRVRPPAAPPAPAGAGASAASRGSRSPSGWRAHPAPRLTAILVVALAIVPELKFRLRDPSAAFTASVDEQILFELLVYAVIAAWIGWYFVRGVASRRYRPSALTAPMVILVFVMFVVLVSAGHALSIRSMIRSLQFAEVVGMTLLVFWESRRDPFFFLEFWIWVRRSVIAFAVVATVLTAANPAWGAYPDEDGLTRFGWFQIHPIVTAGLLGLSMVMIGSMYLGLPDPSFRRPAWRIGAVGLIGVFGMLLIETHSRGALVAALAGLIALIAFSPRRSGRRAASLLALGVVTAATAFVLIGGAGGIEEWVLRGQTVEQVQSLSQRTALFELGQDLIRQEPVFGQGYLMAGPRFRTTFAWAGHAHNVLLEILVSMGFLGVFAFLSLLLVSIARLWRRGKAPPIAGSGLPLEASAILLLLLIHGVISDSFGGSVGFEVSALMLAVLVAALSVRRPASRPARSRVVDCEIIIDRTRPNGDDR